MTRVLLIGWDGADWRILDPLMESGVLPNLAALVSRGGRATLRSTLPTHSWTAWPSFLTGVDPADHGVYDIFESRGRGAHRLPVSFGSIRERTFLADLTDAGVETVMMNVPITFPPPVIKGKLVAGGVLPKDQAENLVIVCGVFIHWDAKDDAKIYQYNYEATKLSIQRAMKGEPKIDEVLAKKETAKHPFYK